MKIIIVTACSVGIAHTYMAAEALEKVGKKMGLELWVETQGCVGIENEVSEDFIREADLVLIAADMGIEKPGRFDGKIKYETIPAEAIKRPIEILESAIEEYKTKQKK
ncbi:MAG: PTS fructose transporter subunit IIB [Anaerolineaceae bacterium]|nr:MAG: PTS fructose transporter subunit IIB [Anaerolineaceae bacterium]